MSVDIADMRKRAEEWLRPPCGQPPITRDRALSEEHLALDVIELLDEINRLRTTLAHSCTCSLADGSAPALRHEKTCELRIAKTQRIDPALALSRFAAAMDECTETERLRVEVRRLKAISELRGNEVAKWANESGVAKGQRDELRARLAAMTVARDELADLAFMAEVPPTQRPGRSIRINELRAVGKETV